MALHDYGPVTAYAWAVENGHFTGTLAEWVEMIGDVSDNAAAAVSAKSDAIMAKNAAISARTAAQTASSDAEAWAKGTRGGTAVESTDPAWHANAAYHAGQAGDSASDAEAFAKGTRGGADVGSSDPAYHNNAKYYAEQAAASAEEASRSYAPVIHVTASGPIAHFTDAAAAPMALDVAISPVQAGSGDPSPTNVRPISGWTGAEVKRTGKNLLKSDKAMSGGNVQLGVSSYDTTAPSIVLPAGTYTLSVVMASGLQRNIYAKDVDADAHIAGFPAYIAYDSAPATKTFTISKTSRIAIWVYNSSLTSIDDVISAQIELGSTATAYEPYTGNDYSITFPNEAGTVYGGTLHINQDGSGVLTVDRAITTVNDQSWTYNSGASQRRFTATFSGIKLYAAARTVPFTSSVFVSIDDGRALGDVPNNGIYGAGTSGVVYIKCTDYSTEEAFKTAYGSAQIVYPIANPSTYTFTAQQISSLLGENNVWADTGDVTAEYTADTKAYIERLTQPDADWIADAGISAGEYFMVGNELYVATSGIAAGETITPGTNCTKKSLAEALNAINAINA